MKMSLAVFLSPWAKTSLIMSMYFLFGLLTLLKSSQVACILLHEVRGLGTETLGMAFLLSPDPVGTMGLSSSLMTDCGCGKLHLAY